MQARIFCVLRARSYGCWLRARFGGDNCADLRILDIFLRLWIGIAISFHMHESCWAKILFEECFLSSANWRFDGLFAITFEHAREAEKRERGKILEIPSNFVRRWEIKLVDIPAETLEDPVCRWRKKGSREDGEKGFSHFCHAPLEFFSVWIKGKLRRKEGGKSWHCKFPRIFSVSIHAEHHAFPTFSRQKFKLNFIRFRREWMGPRALSPW